MRRLKTKKIECKHKWQIVHNGITLIAVCTKCFERKFI